MSDLDGIRKEIDEGLFLAVAAWADLLEESGCVVVAAGMRAIVRAKVIPGSMGVVYCWRHPSLPDDALDAIGYNRYGNCPRGNNFATVSEAILAAATVWGNVMDEEEMNS